MAARRHIVAEHSDLAIRKKLGRYRQQPDPLPKTINARSILPRYGKQNLGRIVLTNKFGHRTQRFQIARCLLCWVFSSNKREPINLTGTEHSKEVAVLETFELFLISNQYHIASADRTTCDGPLDDNFLEFPPCQ